MPRKSRLSKYYSFLTFSLPLLILLQERARGPKFQERYNQATLFWNSLTPVEKDHLVNAACFEIGKTEEPRVRNFLCYFIIYLYLFLFLFTDKRIDDGSLQPHRTRIGKASG
jgi:hypothetical protein